jgi:Uncharacterized conserved protein
MNIAIPYEDGQEFQHFDDSAHLMLYAAKEGRIIGAEVVSTDGHGHDALVGFLVRNGINVLLCDGIGGGAHMALAHAGNPAVMRPYRRLPQRCGGLSCRHAGL